MALRRPAERFVRHALSGYNVAPMQPPARLRLLLSFFRFLGRLVLGGLW